jgi:25S rRNA (uracil2634-N3)-methyltransferase
MTGNKSLKAALSSQQHRLKLKQKAIHAARISEQKERSIAQGRSKARGKGKASASPPTIPFRSTDSILLIGEGNFSFARAMLFDAPAQLESFSPAQLTATAYDSEQECFTKYPGAEEIVKGLKEKGVQVLFGVDGGKLEKTAALKGRRWDRIVWNFPHVGKYIFSQFLLLSVYATRLSLYEGKGITDQDRNILSNQLLILSFLRSASNFLTLGPVPSCTPPRRQKQGEDGGSEDDEIADVNDSQSNRPKSRGTVLITLRNVNPYTEWFVLSLEEVPQLTHSTTGTFHDLLKNPHALCYHPHHSIPVSHS